jgi:hypothetical protein
MSENDNRELRNSIFSAQQAAMSANNGGVPVVSREEYAKRELGIEIPVDAVPLPSAGKVYGLEHPLHNASQIEYRAMTARDEDILMSRALIKKGTVISELIKACLINPSIDVGSLLTGDRNALMIAVRISGYGREYAANWNCTSCEFKNEIEFDLTELPIKPLSLEPANAGENLFRFKLPVSNKTVGFKFLTGKEEEEIAQQMEMRKKKGIVTENVVTTRLLNSIVEIDGNRERGLISKLVNYMPARDSLELRKYIEDHEPGVNMTVTFNCRNCDHTEEGALPMGSTFFWPNSRK